MDYGGVTNNLLIAENVYFNGTYQINCFFPEIFILSQVESHFWPISMKFCIGYHETIIRHQGSRASNTLAHWIIALGQLSTLQFKGLDRGPP